MTIACCISEHFLFRSIYPRCNLDIFLFHNNITNLARAESLYAVVCTSLVFSHHWPLCHVVTMEDGSVVKSMVRRASWSLVQEVVDVSWLTPSLGAEGTVDPNHQDERAVSREPADGEHEAVDDVQLESETEDVGESKDEIEAVQDTNGGVEDEVADNNGEEKDDSETDRDKATVEDEPGVEDEGVIERRVDDEDEAGTRDAGREVVAINARETDPFFLFLSGLRMPQLYDELVAGGISCVQEVIEVEDAQELVDDYGLKKSQARKLIKAAQQLSD